jgi:hypothetical protein
MAEVGSLGTIPGLFQTGYLTIDSVKVEEEDDEECFFSLKVPNLEVRKFGLKVFSELLFQLLGRKPEEEATIFKEAVQSKNSEKLTEIISALFAGLSASIHKYQEKINESEGFYHGILWGYCNPQAETTVSEPKSSTGDPDLVVTFKGGLVAVIELKFDAGSEDANKDDLVTNLAENALKAIEDKKYGDLYKWRGKKVVKIGVGVTTRGQCAVLVENDPARPK